ncbi:20 kDa chaperonin, chloroplastic-like [Aegilops tauschii subsp. strangulata]|uniref:20 kDa chaperonin, chloroplastic-like n=1 Tax=Aegilops tauschii subsp. strangulata TaxID=200361 RepID=UPI003CC8BAEC
MTSNICILESYDVKDMKPLNDRVLIKVAEASDKTEADLILTQTTKERPSIGTVVAVGPGSLDEEGKSFEFTIEASMSDSVNPAKLQTCGLMKSFRLFAQGVTGTLGEMGIREVVAFGPGSLDNEGKRKPFSVLPGSTVMYSTYAGDEFKGTANYIVLRVSDMMAELS